ncbi:MAG: response regulator transcription factor, partial [Proteobacteria bacterium]|nr:response regulator transcription factor [Pseudomonadota bacterium]
MKVLLVEDSERLQRSLLTGLHKSGFSVDQAFDGKQAMEFVASNQYEVIILDMMLPKIDGLTVLTSIRSRGNNVHILILSANDQTEDRIRGLDLGADDYLVKPFAFDELVSRLRALSRRSNGTKNPLIEIEGVKIHSVSRYVYFDGKEVPFTPHEYNIFEFMARRRGRGAGLALEAELAAPRPPGSPLVGHRISAPCFRGPRPGSHRRGRDSIQEVPDIPLHLQRVRHRGPAIRSRLPLGVLGVGRPAAIGGFRRLNRVVL